MAYKKKVFISYNHQNDSRYKNLLLAWNAHALFDFSFRDHSADLSVNSTNTSTVKSVISRYINTATYFLVIIGPHTHKSPMVRWEIDKAVMLNKRIIAVKTNKSNISPQELFGIGASWAMSFRYLAIINAINSF